MNYCITKGPTENCRSKFLRVTWIILQKFEPATFTSAVCFANHSATNESVLQPLFKSTVGNVSINRRRKKRTTAVIGITFKNQFPQIPNNFDLSLLIRHNFLSYCRMLIWISCWLLSHENISETIFLAWTSIYIIYIYI